MFRFTIRDVLWLTVVVGVSLAWFIHASASKAAYLAQEQAMEQRADAAVAYFKEQLIRDLLLKPHPDRNENPRPTEENCQ